jgi:hypothetical protein
MPSVRMIAFAIVVAADLIMLRRIDSKEADACAVDFDRVAVDNRGLSQFVGTDRLTKSAKEKDRQELAFQWHDFSSYTKSGSRRPDGLDHRRRLENHVHILAPAEGHISRLPSLPSGKFCPFAHTSVCMSSSALNLHRSRRTGLSTTPRTQRARTRQLQPRPGSRLT